VKQRGIEPQATGVKDLRPRVFQTASFFCDPGAARTRGPYIKSVLLYQLSYEIIMLVGTDSNRRTRKRADLQSAGFSHSPTYQC
jgi:hypothetical protein